jgi:hypothetical protein
MSLTIIGFGKVTSKDLGEIGQDQSCIWCSAQMSYHLICVRTWFTYFFIPVIPYRSAYRVTCPSCGEGMTISGEEVRAAKRGELTLRRG